MAQYDADSFFENPPKMPLPRSAKTFCGLSASFHHVFSYCANRRIFIDVILRDIYASLFINQVDLLAMWVLAMQISAVRVSAVANLFQKFSYFYKFPLHAAKYYIFIVINHIVVRVLVAEYRSGSSEKEGISWRDF